MNFSQFHWLFKESGDSRHTTSKAVLTSSAYLRSVQFQFWFSRSPGSPVPGFLHSPIPRFPDFLFLWFLFFCFVRDLDLPLVWFEDGMSGHFSAILKITCIGIFKPISTITAYTRISEKVFQDNNRVVWYGITHYGNVTLFVGDSWKANCKYFIVFFYWWALNSVQNQSIIGWWCSGFEQSWKLTNKKYNFCHQQIE